MKLLLLIVAVCVSAVLAVEVEKAESRTKLVFCYYGAWAVYRPGEGKFDVEDIDPFICTHVIFGFASLNVWGHFIEPIDPWNDLCDQGGKCAYERMVALKQINPNLKVLLAIGGWNEGSVKYSEMAANPSWRKIFVDSVVDFMQTFKFDGFDFDWEYPTQRGGIPADKVNYVLLLKELKEAFNPSWLLTSAVSPGKTIIEEGYDIPEVSKYLDYISVMCYDYHGAWQDFTSHNSPLYPHPFDAVAPGDLPYFNVNFTINYWLDRGAPKEKIIMGMPLYGRGWTIPHGTDNVEFYAPAIGPIIPGPYSREDGFWAYNEICNELQTNPSAWTVLWNDYVKAPYAYSDDYWIGYDDEESLRIKVDYAKTMGLEGVMVWSLESDDFQNTCNKGKNHIIQAIRDELELSSVVSGTTNNPSGTTSKPEVTTNGSGMCSNGAGFYPNPDYCDQYYICQDLGNNHFQIHEYHCETGLVWDVNIGGCNWEHLATTVDGCQ